MLEEKGEESTRHCRVGFRQHRRENTEDPVTSVHLGANVMLFEVVVELGQMLLDK